jgi:hypothetical protein
MIVACVLAIAASAASLAVPPLGSLSESELRSLSHAELLDAILRTRGSSRGALRSTTAAAPAHQASEPLPRGSYRKSCIGCTRMADVLTCRCLGRGDVLPTASSFTSTNLSGGWHSTAPRGAQAAVARFQLGASTHGHTAKGGRSFDVQCMDGGDAAPTPCKSLPPPYTDDSSWHTANGTVAASDGAVLLSLHTQGQGGHTTIRGSLTNNGTRIKWQQPPSPPAAAEGARGGLTRAWQRDTLAQGQPLGKLTSISLGSCQPVAASGGGGGGGSGGEARVTNRDGYLSCRWEDSPPPRVGPLTDRGWNQSAETCRYIHHTSFISPRFSNDGVVLQQIDLLPVHHSYQNLSGSWSSYAGDGTYQDVTLDIITSTSTSAGGELGSTWAGEITCVDAGPDNGCDPRRSGHDTQGGNGGWHRASARVKSHGRTISVTYDTQSQNTGVINRNNSAITWKDGSRWVRKNVNQVDICCSACEAFTGCRGWTIQGGVCHLVNSVGQSYPDPTAISGYRSKADAATYCLHNTDNGGGGDTYSWGDHTMDPNISCVPYTPSGAPHNAFHDSANSSYFPRHWTANTGGSFRGTAWMFFPRSWCSAGQRCNSCDCRCNGRGCVSVYCQGGPDLSTNKRPELFRGKPWSVFIHGGEFHWNNNIGANYAMLSDRIASAANMGVLAIDYRTTAAVPPDVGTFPAAILDVIAALEWLRKQNVSKLALYGDSSGATQVVETLIYLEHERELLRQQKLQQQQEEEEEEEEEEQGEEDTDYGVVRVDR